MNESKYVVRSLLAFTLIVATASTVFTIATGEIWPLFLATTMLICSMIIVAGEALARD